MADRVHGEVASASAARRVRVDAQRNLAGLLHAAKEVFAEQGVDAPVREIAARAGVGVGTLYRHYPRRADLIAAVFRQEMDACADAADALAATHAPFDALAAWMDGFVELAATKHGLAQALHSGDPAFDSLPARREERLRPAFRMLYEAALSAGEIRTDVEADEFLNAAANLCTLVRDAPPARAHRLVGLLVKGLRADPSAGGSDQA